MGIALSSYAVQLSGSYTINPAAPASTTNFKDFKSAIIYLTDATTRPDGGPSNAAPFGISGPVKFTVSPGVYTGQVVIPNIAGTSPVNTLTFEGSNVATCILKDSIVSQAILIVDQAKYVYLRQLTVENIGKNNVSGIAIVGNAGNNAGTGCRITGCIVNVPNTNISYTSYGIITTATALGAGTSNNQIDSVWIDSNTINGGYYSLAFYGNTSGNIAYNRANKARFNTLNNVKYMGLYIYYHYNQFDLMYNTVNMDPSTSTTYGVYFYYCRNSTAVPSQIIGNKIINAAYMGIYIASSNAGTGAPTKIYNNMISGTFGYSTNYGLYCVTTHNVDVSHNTIDIGEGSAGTTKNALYFSGAAAGNIFKNNIFSISALSGTTVYPANFATNPTGNVANYNNYYNRVNTNLVNRGGVYTTATYKTATAGGDSSFNIQPKFISATDVGLADGCGPRGFDLTATIPTDIFGTARPASPSCGAHEYVAVANDVSIDSYLYPTPPAVAGPTDLAVLIKNTGSATVTSFNVAYTLNGGTPVVMPWTGSLAPCDTVRIIFTGADQINLGAANKIKVFTSLPNGVADQNNLNDSIAKTSYIPLAAGVYPVGPTRSYKNLNEAIDVLNYGGVTGPVEFVLDPGTYNNGQLNIIGPVYGASATNTITFDGVDKSTRIVTANFSGATFLINQASYITIKNLTVNNTFNGPATGIALVGNATNNAGVGFTVKNSTVNLPNVPNGTASYGIIVTGALSGLADDIQRVDSVTIDSNTINGGYYGIQISTSSTGNASFNRNHKIRYNTVNSWYYGIRVYYIYNPVEISYNTVNMHPDNLNSYGIYLYYNQCGATAQSTKVIGNKVYAGYLGIYDYYAINTAPAYPHMVHNNMITVFSATAWTGLYVYTGASGGAVYQVYHNTVNMLGFSATYGLYYYNSTGSNSASFVKNNIFKVAGPATYPAYFGTNPAAGTVNYNNYYNLSSGRLGYRGSEFTVLNYKTATAGGDSSFNLDPEFIGETDLHATTGCTPMGANLTADVPVDFDGDIRSIPPRIGADEYNGLADDIAIDKMISPAQPVVAGSQDFVIRLKNQGNTTITSFTVAYKNNTGATITQPWVGTLAPCDTVSITFTGADQINIGAANNILVYTSAPNGLVDSKRTNDTLRVTVLVPLNGNYTIGATGTYPTFEAATTALFQGGLTGPVTFTVQPGTYNERVTVPKGIVGVSATNTITFDGVDAATRIVTDSSGQGAFTVNQVNYVIIKNLTVTNLWKANSAGIVLVGNTLSNAGVGFTVKNCIVNLPNVPNGTTSYGINVTGNPMGISDINQWTDSVTIDSNTINGGYYGINIGTSANGNALYNRNHKIRYNTVNAWYYGIRFYYIYNPADISYNTINMHPDNASSYGLYYYYNVSGAAPASSRLVSNKIYAGYAGIYDYYGTNTDAAYPKLIHNNMVTVFGTTAYVGMYIYTANTGGSISQIYHNSVNMLGTSATNGLYYYNSTGSTSLTMIKNNIFRVSGSASYPAYYSTNPVAGTINFNNYYNPAGVRLGYRGSEFTVLNYKLATSGGDSSFNSDPMFISTTNLHSNNACSKGANLTAFVATDIDGDVRPANPVIGADETTGLANDIGIDKLYIGAPIMPGAQDLTVRIKNFSPNTNTSATVSYILNNAAPVNLTWTGSMAGCGDTALVTFTGSQQPTIVSGFNSLKTYTTDPNGTIDNYRNNDSVLSALSTITKVSGNAFSGNGTGGLGTGSAVRFESKPQMIGSASTKFTVEAWVKVAAWSDQKFVAKSNVSNGFALGIDPTGRLDAEIWTVANGTGSVRITTQGTSLPTNVIPVNTWTHVAATWESGVGVRAYINGQLVGFLNSATATTMSQSTNDLYIGSNSWDGGHAVTGQIDEVRLWGVALDSVSIRRHMYSALTGTETGLNTYIQFNEPLTSTTFSDVIGASTGFKGNASAITASTLPFGSDSSMTLTGITVGYFASMGATVNIVDPFDNNCDLTITEIAGSPNTLPGATNKYNNRYWNIRSFGAAGTYAADLTFTDFTIGHLNTTDAALGLYRRDNNSDGVWSFVKLSSAITPTSVTFNAVDTFGQFTVASNGTSTLPVSLIAFGAKAQKDAVNVTWSTSNEISSSHFDVERAYEGSEDFEAIGTVKGAGNSKNVLNYVFVDAKADLSQTIYYRLKQVDMDGRYKYSPVAVVTPQTDEKGISVYPNPLAEGDLHIAFTADNAQVATVTVTDITGKVVYTENVNTKAGRNQLNIGSSVMEKGVYFVTLSVNGSTQNTKLIKN